MGFEKKARRNVAAGEGLELAMRRMGKRGEVTQSHIICAQTTVGMLRFTVKDS